jgi:hypothetical protein
MGQPHTCQPHSPVGPTTSATLFFVTAYQCPVAFPWTYQVPVMLLGHLPLKGGVGGLTLAGLAVAWCLEWGRQIEFPSGSGFQERRCVRIPLSLLIFNLALND